MDISLGIGGEVSIENLNDIVIYICGQEKTTNYWFVKRLNYNILLWYIPIDKGNPVDNKFKGSANCVKADTSGVYIGGVDGDPATFLYNWRVEKRSHDNGTLLWKRVYSNNQSVVYDMALDNDYLYVIGWDENSSVQGRIEKLTLSNGDVIWTQEVDYDQTNGISIAVNDTYVFVGISSSDSSWTWEIRSKNDGSLITRDYYPYENDYYVYRVKADNSGFYLSGKKSNGATYDYSIEKRDMAGVLLWAESITNADYYKNVWDMALSQTNIYTDATLTWFSTFIEKRNLDGVLDWSISPTIQDYYYTLNTFENKIVLAGNEISTAEAVDVVMQDDINKTILIREKTTSNTWPHSIYAIRL